jgi:formylglycine-generating enzyme required for sulfatase activity
MAFTLDELYKHRRTDTGSLSMAYYENELGGVQGAIDKQAETAIGRIKRGRGFIEGKLHELFFDLVEVNDQGVTTRRRASKAKIDRDPAKKKLTASLVEARILVTGHETASTCEMAHEAIFTGWLRLAKWIEANADAMRICRNLRIAAGDWKAKGASPLRYLPDGATLRQYRRVNDKCRYEKKEDEAAVGRYLAAARRRRQMVGLLLALAVIIGSMLGLDSFRNSRDMSWSAMQIWGLAKAGIYEGPLMVTVPAGCFVIGCVDESSYCRKEQKRYPQVCLDTFEMSRHEVTQDLWTAIMGNNPAYFKEAGGRHPVEQVSWGDTLKFIRRLNELTGKQFRLPTEAEWEYAARSGGKDQTYAGGDDFDELGWSLHNSGGMTHPVGQKRPNGLGLYDMSGNVWEWVEDEWHRDYEGAPIDGSAWLGDSMGFGRVVRGGGLNVDAGMCRSTSRYHYGAAVRYGALGFRLARSVNLDR